MAIDKDLYSKYKNQNTPADQLEKTEDYDDSYVDVTDTGFGYNSINNDITKVEGVKATDFSTAKVITSNGNEYNKFDAKYNEHMTLNEDGYSYEEKIWNPKTQKYETEVITHKYSGDKVYSSEAEKWLNVQMAANKYMSTEEIKQKIYTSNNDMSDMLSSTTITSHDVGYLNRFNKFARYGSIDPTNMLNPGCKEYIFFSKPDLHLFGTMTESDTIGCGTISNCTSLNPELENVPFFKEMYNHYRYSMYSLQQSFDPVTLRSNKKTNTSSNFKEYDIDLTSKFMNILSNNVNGSLELPGITASEQQTNQNLYSIYTTYREGSETSDLQHEFSLEFQDTKYLDVYMLFKIYDEYFRMKYYLEISPANDQYILNRIYPEAFSIWKILVDDTGRIVYWCKLIGVTPMSVPRESITSLADATITFSVNFKAQFIREMDPVSLLELNHLVEKSVNMTQSELADYFKRDKTKPIYDNVSKLTYSNGDTWVKYPYVYSASRLTRTGDKSSLDGDGIPLKNRGFYRLVWI